METFGHLTRSRATLAFAIAALLSASACKQNNASSGGASAPGASPAAAPSSAPAANTPPAVARPATPPPPPGPTLPNEGLHAVEVTGAGSHACARLESGAVHCWGYAPTGQLGTGQPPVAPTSAPGAPVAGLTDAEQVSCNYNSCCALRHGGAIVCWGANDRGQLGDGTHENRNAPVPNGITDAVQIAQGKMHGCALRQGGRISCWGANMWSQTGDPTAQENLRPIELPAMATPIVQLVAGDFTNCGRTAAGQVSCWGSNNWNRLGHTFATLTTKSASPVEVTGLDDAIDIAAGEEHLCAVRRGGTVVCWGSGELGALGNGTETTTNVTPVAVTGVTNAVEVRAGSGFSCARLADGQVMCWGANWQHQLGDASFTERLRSTAGVVPGLTDARSLSVRGSAGGCARRASGVMLCWGANPGNGSSSPAAAPVALRAVP